MPSLVASAMHIGRPVAQTNAQIVREIHRMPPGSAQSAFSLSSPARRALVLTSVLMGVLGCALRPWPLALLAVALSVASSLNYVLYTGAFTLVSAVDMAFAVLAGGTYIVCVIVESCWLGLGAAMVTMAAYAMRRHPDDQVTVHVLALASLLVYMASLN